MPLNANDDLTLRRHLPDNYPITPVAFEIALLSTAGYLHYNLHCTLARRSKKNRHQNQVRYPMLANNRQALGQIIFLELDPSCNTTDKPLFSALSLLRESSHTRPTALRPFDHHSKARHQIKYTTGPSI